MAHVIPDNPASPASSLVERLAQEVTASASAQAIYGTPVERNGITVIPVARTFYGFGAGGGSRLAKAEGAGGGAGAAIIPVGYIELKQGSTRFRPIRSSVVPLVAVSGLIALALLRSVPRLLRKR